MSIIVNDFHSHKDYPSQIEQESLNSTKTTAVLLVNLGSPEKPSVVPVMVFLRQFLMDKRVVKLPRLLWWLILHLFVLPLRSFKTVKLYKKIWMQEGSPLIVYTQRLAKKIEAALLLQKNYMNKKIFILSAMTYGKPLLKNAIQQIVENKISSLIVIPLFPQYSSVTTAAVFDAVAKCFKDINGPLPSLKFVSHYYSEGTYLEALAHSINDYWTIKGKQEKLLFSFHGLPERNIHDGDPYVSHCQMTARACAKILNIPENYWKIAFQSRFGWANWVGPSIEKQIEEWLEDGVKSILVIAPSFAVDCLETKEEIELRTRTFFLKKGGQEFHYIPALNDSDMHVNAIISLIQKNF